MTFQEFIDNVGVRKIAMMCGVTEGAVYKWRSLQGTPRPDTAYVLIVQSSKLLDFDKIYMPYVRKVLQGKTITSHMDGQHGVQLEFNFDK